jgi:hypothetical protein
MNRQTVFTLSLLVLAVASHAATVSAPASTAAAPVTTAAAPKQDSGPMFFEPRLKAHPADESLREAAMDWYSARPDDLERLKLHTWHMIATHPGNIHIFTSNVAAFYRDTAYRSQAIARLEREVDRGHTDHSVYWNLALISQHGAVPPIREGSWSRDEFLKHYGLPDDTKLPEKVDKVLAEKSIRYYRTAIAACVGNNYYFGFYSEQLATLLHELGKYRDALKVFEAALPKVDNVEKPSFLVSYGTCLRDAKHTDEAIDILGQVRACDKNGPGSGPAYATALAETELGLISIAGGRVNEAVDHLQASCAMRPFPTNAMPLRLARKLLALGDTVSVINYCRTVLEKFAPHQREAKDLLKQAIKAGG